MKISNENLIKLRNEFGSSFYIFDKDKFISNFLSYRNTFCELYPKTEIAYAYKANYMPVLGDIIHEYKGMIEVVSDLEYQIALKSIGPGRIVYNGPVKTKGSLYQALKQGSIVNVDSLYEIEYIKELLNEEKLKEACIGIRINFKLLHYTSRFGFNIENGELDKALNVISMDQRIRIVSIHSHYSTKEKSLEIFSNRARLMCDVYKKLQADHPIEYLNIGGGFFGEMPAELIAKFQVKVPCLREYAETISKVLLEELEAQNLPTLVIEPGISMVGNTMKLFAEILEIKKIDGMDIAVCDTSINVVNPTKSAISPAFHLIKKRKSEKNDEVVRKYNIVGNTCMEHDIILENYTGVCERGDFLMFENRGAYSNVYTPPFIMPPPPIISMDGGIYKFRDHVNSILSVYRYKSKD